MPIYEYACVKSNHRFEVFQKMSDPAPSECPTCGDAEVRKLVSQAAFVLKGGGWYKDHYGLKSGSSSSEPSSGGSSSSGESAGASASASTTPSAPAASSAPTAPAPSAPAAK